MTATYRFGRFELQPSQGRLLEHGHPIVLGHRAFDVLVTLVERAGQLVTKDQLLALVWPGLVVEENNLQVQVSALRKVLGTAAITTTPGRGYRFTPEVTRAGAPLEAPVAQRHNLPAQITSFIGHEDDLDEYAVRVEETRLLTLTGIGGCGKTRLALELAERLLPSFPDGVWYVDLAPLLDAERVPLTVATTLDICEENERPILDTLCARLASHRMLLVLDNCEHLAAACAALIKRVIGAAPDVRVLAGSREGLGVPGERAMTVRSLSFPPPGIKHDLRALETCEAVRLFVERVQLSFPKFSLADDTAQPVAEICRRLDGIPLAIELAAARVKVLSVEEIRARLDHRFRLLTGSSKTALGRQQTLLATIQWSYDHLAPDQQQLLRQLAVFAGGWTLEGAMRVAGEELDEYAVLDLLASLVDQSLVTTQRLEGGMTRYVMLETVRQYAHERLNEAGESEAARDRHLAFYVALVEAAEPELVGPGQRAWLARIDAEGENFLVAHTWCDQAERGAELGLRLVFSLNKHFDNRGLHVLGRRVAVEALARPRAQARNLVRCRALYVAGVHSYRIGSYGDAKDFAEASLAIAREMDDELRAAEAHRYVGKAELALGNVEAAREHCQEAIALSRRLADKHELAKALNGLAELYRAGGHLNLAQPLYEESLAIHREREDHGNIALELGNLAWVSINVGSKDRARGMLREGFAIIVEIGAKRTGVALLDCSTGLAALVNEWEFAARLNGATEALAEQIGQHREPADEATYAPFIARTRDALGTAAFAAAESAGRSLSYEDAVAEARAWLDQVAEVNR